MPVFLGFPYSAAGKESTCNAGGLGSVPGLGRSPGEGKGYPLPCSGLENPTDCIGLGVRKESDTTSLLLSLLWCDLFSFSMAHTKCSVTWLWAQSGDGMLTVTSQKLQTEIRFLALWGRVVWSPVPTRCCALAPMVALIQVSKSVLHSQEWQAMIPSSLYTA